MDAQLADLARSVEAEGFGVKVSLELEAATVRGTLVARAVYLDAQEALAKSTQNATLLAILPQWRALPVQPGVLHLIDTTLTVGPAAHHVVVKLPAHDGTFAVLSKNSTVAVRAVKSWKRGERVPALELG